MFTFQHRQLKERELFKQKKIKEQKEAALRLYPKGCKHEKYLTLLTANQIYKVRRILKDSTGEYFLELENDNGIIFTDYAHRFRAIR